MGFTLTDPLYQNYMALYLCVCRNYSISKALSVMGVQTEPYGHRGGRKKNVSKP